MAHSAQINVNGILTTVTEFDSSAQAIDDAVAVLGAPTTPQAALSALGAGVRPRLGINMDFQINQRGQTSYAGSGKTYTVDGWYLSNTGGTVTVNLDGTITLGTTNNNFWQLIPPDEFMMGAPFTFSVLTPDGKLYTMTVDELSTSTNQSQTTDFGLIRVQYYNGNVGVNINSTQKSVTLLCAKPESGPNQTLAYQDSTGAWHRLPQPEDGDYAGQLAKCQAYQVVINTLDIIGATNNATTLYANIPTPVTMRALPAIENNGVFNVRGGGTNQANLTAATYSNSLNANGIRVGIAGQFTANEPYHVSITSPIILNANL